MNRQLSVSNKLQTVYWSVVAAMSGMILSINPTMAAPAADIWSRFSDIMKDIYGEIVAISTIVAVTVAAIALVVRMVSRNQRAVDEATSLEKERRIPTRAGIVIQSQTGLRINEVLSIQEGCLSTTNDGYTFLEVEISKTEKGEPIKHKVYANELVVKCVNELSEYTKHLREKSGLKELFLVNARGTITNSKSNCWTQKRLRPFIRRWDIRDKDGNLYPLQSHQFRATFVRELIKQNVPLSHIMKQFAHVSIEMTMHYLTLQEKEIKEIYADMVLSPDSKIAGMRAAEIKSELNNEFKGKTPNEIDDIISDLAESMSFNPLPNGICLYDFRRGNCTDGDGCFFYNCPNYITEVKFYPILKKELDLMELEMKRLKKLGREREWQRQYVKQTHLKRLVDELEAQQNG